MAFKNYIFTTTGAGTWTIPGDFDPATATITVIGGGAGGSRSTAGANNPRGGGGGGAYGKSNASALSNYLTVLVPGATVYYNIGAGGTGATANGTNGTGGGNTWFNHTANTAPTSTTTGVLAAGGTASTGTAGGAGGTNAASFATTENSGGAGGSAAATNRAGGGGGGGAGRPAGAGGTGGGSGAAQGSGGGGGGGDAGNGTASAATSGGAGGAGGSNGATTAAGGTASGGAGTAGTLGGGGGGGGGSTTNGATAGAGGAGGDGDNISLSGTTFVNGVSSGITAIGSGGGGGAGGGNNNNTAGTGGAGGAGGAYGGGGGSGGGAQTTTGNGGNGGSGVLLITYDALTTNRTLYWVGGSGTWDGSTSGDWALTPGGAVESGLFPGSTDNVVFNASSGTGTCTIGSNATCKNLTISTNNITFTGTGALTITGNITTTNLVTFGHTGTLSITGTGVTISSTATFNSTININGSATLTADFSTSNTAAVTVVGSINVSTFSLSVGTFAANTGSTVTFGSGGRIVILTTASTTIISLNSGCTLSGTVAFRITNSTTNIRTIDLGAKFTSSQSIAMAGGAANGLELPTGANYFIFTSIGTIGSLTLNPSSSSSYRLPNVSVAGNITIGANATMIQDAAVVTVTGTSTITTNGVTFGNQLTIDAPGATVTLGSALTLPGSFNLTVTAGTFTTSASNFSITCPKFISSNTNTRSITLNSSVITLTDTSTIWDLTTTTGLTFSGASSTINITSTGAAAKTFQSGARTYGTIVVGSRTQPLNSNGAVFNFHGAATYGTFYFQYTLSSSNPSLRFEGGITHTFTTLTVSGFSTGAATALNINTISQAAPAATLAIGSTNQFLPFTSVSNITKSGTGLLYITTSGSGNTGLTTGVATAGTQRYLVRATPGPGVTSWGTQVYWAYISGGAGGTTTTSTTAVIIDSNSSSGAPVLQVASAQNCAGISSSIACTLDLSSSLTSAGNTNLTNITITGTGGLTLSATQTFTPVGNTLEDLTVTAGTVTLSGSTLTVTDLINISGGSFAVSGTTTISAGRVQVISTASINITNSTLNLKTGWVVASTATATTTGSTINVGTAGGTSAVRYFRGGGKTYNIVRLQNLSTDTLAFTDIYDANTFTQLLILNNVSTAGYHAVTIQSNQTIVNSGTFNATGQGGASRIRLASNVFGTARTIAFGTTPSVTLTDVDFADITLSAVSASGTRLGNLGNNTGITFATPKTVYWNAVTGGNWDNNSWAATSGGAVARTNFPLPQDTVVFNTTGLNAGQTITLNKPWHIPNIAGSTSVLRSFNLALYDITGLNYGDWIISATNLATGDLDLQGSSTAITMTGINATLGFTAIACRPISGTATIAGNGFAGLIQLANGTFDTTGTNTSSASMQSTTTSANSGFDTGSSVAIGYGNVTTTGTWASPRIVFTPNTGGTLTVSNSSFSINSFSGSTALVSISPAAATTATGVSISANPGSGQAFTISFNVGTGSTVTCSPMNGGIISISGTGRLTGASLSVSTGTSGTISGNVSCDGGSPIIDVGGVTATGLNITTAGGTTSISSTTTLGTLTVGNGGVSLGNITCGAVTWTGAGAINIGNSSNIVLSCPSFTTTGTSGRTLTFGGSGKISLTGTGTVWDSSSAFILTVSGISNIELNNNTSVTRTIATGTSTGRENLSFNIISGTGNVQTSGICVMRSLNTTGYTGDFIIFAADLNIYGNLTLGTGSRFMSTGAGIDLIMRGGTGGTPQTITTNGVAIGFTGATQQAYPNIEISQSATNVQLADALTAPSISQTHGTFTTNNHNVTLISASISGTNARTLNMGSSVWTITGTGTVWDASVVTNLTLNAGTSEIIFTNTTASARSFLGANSSRTYNKITIGGTGGSSSTFTFNSNMVVNVLASTRNVAHTILFGTDSTTNIGAWSINGSSGNVVTIGRSGTGATPILNYTGAGIVEAEYLNISFSAATPANTWYAANSTDGGNNTGWIFGRPANGNFFMLFYV